MAVACCSAAKVLHDKQLVHRDLRLPNVVQLGPRQYMVIDLESAAWASNAALPKDFQFKLRTCTVVALNSQRCFTIASDMHCIGQLLQRAAFSPSSAAQAFIDLLIQKRLTAGRALQHLQTQWTIA